MQSMHAHSMSSWDTLSRRSAILGETMLCHLWESLLQASRTSSVHPFWNAVTSQLVTNCCGSLFQIQIKPKIDQPGSAPGVFLGGTLSIDVCSVGI